MKNKWSFACPWCKIVFYKRKKFEKHFGACLERSFEEFLGMVDAKYPILKIRSDFESIRRQSSGKED